MGRPLALVGGAIIARLTPVREPENGWESEAPAGPKPSRGGQLATDPAATGGLAGLRGGLARAGGHRRKDRTWAARSVGRTRGGSGVAVLASEALRRLAGSPPPQGQRGEGTSVPCPLCPRGAVLLSGEAEGIARCLNGRRRGYGVPIRNPQAPTRPPGRSVPRRGGARCGREGCVRPRHHPEKAACG